MDPHDRPWRHILRHGALMPLYMLVLYDLALGRGFVARLFSLPGMSFLGQTSFSIFIWQNLFMGLGFAMASWPTPTRFDQRLVLVRRHRTDRDGDDQHVLDREADARKRLRPRGLASRLDERKVQRLFVGGLFAHAQRIGAGSS